MLNADLLGNDEPDFDPIQFERAAQRSVADLQRIVGALVQRYVGQSRRGQPIANHALSWRALLEFEEQAFADLGFQARHDKAIIDAFFRLSARTG